MSARRVVIELTPAQARMVNAALALLEAEDHDDRTWNTWYRPGVMERTRAAVWRGLDAAHVEP